MAIHSNNLVSRGLDLVKKLFLNSVDDLYKAAEQGSVSAQFTLAYRYSEGQGVSIDYEKAIKWYHKAAEQGYVGAQNNLGVMYLKGQGVPINYEEAIKWFYKAAERGMFTLKAWFYVPGARRTD